MMITLQMVIPAHVRLPRVYKYLRRRWIELFFEQGILRIQSFQTFREYPDEVRGDKSEGGGAIRSPTKEGMQVVGVTTVGEDAYVFSTSTIESVELMKEFDTDGCFCIKDPLNFSVAVARAIPGLTQSIQGLCDYQQLRLVDKSIPDMSTDDFTDDSGQLIIGGPRMLQRLGEMQGDGTDLMFLKEKQNYQRQSEYRFIWKVNSQYYKRQPFLDIECKEAIQFCEKTSLGQDSESVIGSRRR